MATAAAVVVVCSARRRRWWRCSSSAAVAGGSVWGAGWRDCGRHHHPPRRGKDKGHAGKGTYNIIIESSGANGIDMYNSLMYDCVI